MTSPPDREELRRQVNTRVAEEEITYGTGAKETHGSVRRFALVSAEDLCANPMRPRWLVRGFLEMGTFASIYGPSAGMKSFVAIDMGLCIASGRDWHGHPVLSAGPVVYVCGEGFAGIGKRVRAWLIHYGLEAASVPFYVSNSPVSFLEPDSVAEAVAAVQAPAKDIGAPRLVIIDTLARNFGPGDENSTGDMSRFVAALDVPPRRRDKKGGSFMNLLDHPSLAGAMKQVTASELAGPCPFCGGVDRFRLWPSEGATGRWMCRGCGRSGDAIAFIMEHGGVGYVEACHLLGTEPKSTKMGNARKATAWEPKPSILPGDVWTSAAGRFVDCCAAALAAGGPGLDYARGRGLTAKTCAALRIGWNPSDLYQDRAAWGLPEEINPRTGKPRRVWQPKGLVIPTLRDGNVVAIKIRRSEWKPEDFLPKYCAVTGSATAPMILAPGQGKPVIVTESELDAILCAQEVRDLVTAIALRTARAKPDAEAHALLTAAPVILVATDADEAGATAWPWWREHYPKAVRWPVPGEAKDVGDLAATPGLIRAWIEAGLPEPVQSVEPEPKPETSPPGGKSSLCRADALAHGVPSTTSEAELTKLRETFPHLCVCPATTPPWNFRYVSDCTARCKTPCELQATN